MRQDPIEYDNYTWHSNLDTYERVVEEDVIKSAIVLAATVYHLATRDELLPRFSNGEMPKRPPQNDQRTMNPEVSQLLAILDQAYNKPSWHGTNLRGSVRRVTPAQAAWRPGPGRHNIWEIVVHAAYWKYAAARRFTGGARGSFPLKGSNWFQRPVDVGRIGRQGVEGRSRICSTTCTTRCGPP